MDLLEIHQILYDTFEAHPTLVHERAGHRLFTYSNAIHLAYELELPPEQRTPPNEYMLNAFKRGFESIRQIYGDEKIENLVPGLIAKFYVER